MPLRARLVVIAGVGCYLLATALLLSAAFRLLPQLWLSAVLATALLVVTLLLLDAFYPPVSLLVRSYHKIPQRAGQRTIALTFDDGPVYPYTGQILDILDQFEVKASFFCIGENVRSHPELATEIVRRGHTLGNHTQTHKSLLLAGIRRARREVQGAQQTLQQACDSAPAFFRCPKGYKNLLVAAVLRQQGLTLAAYGYPIWDVQNPPATELVARVLKRAAPGDIILMHDGYAPGKPGKRNQLVAALPRILEGLLKQNIKPVSLDQAIRQKS